jgi:hypothetical protein
MQQAKPEKEAKPKPGEALQRALEARGIEISLEEAQRLASTLLGFIERGLLVPVDRSG